MGKKKPQQEAPVQQTIYEAFFSGLPYESN